LCVTWATDLRQFCVSEFVGPQECG